MSLQDRMLLFWVTNDLKSLVAKRIFWKNSSLVFTFTTLPSVLLQLNYTFTSERPTLLLNEAIQFVEFQAQLPKIKIILSSLKSLVRHIFMYTWQKWISNFSQPFVYRSYSVTQHQKFLIKHMLKCEVKILIPKNS